VHVPARTRCLPLQARDSAQRILLPAARRAEHDEKLAVADGQVHLLHGDRPVRVAHVQGRDLDACHQRRTAPSVTPATRCLRTRYANTSTGTANTHADAATRPQSTVVPPMSPAIAGGAVRTSRLEVRKMA